MDGLADLRANPFIPEKMQINRALRRSVPVR